MPSVGRKYKVNGFNIKIIKIIRWAAGGGIFIAVNYVSTEVLLSLSPGGPESLRE